MMLFEEAVNEQKNGNFEKAEIIYRKILSEDANNFDALHMLAIVCTEISKLEESEQLFRKAISIDARFPPCYHNFGLLYVKREEYQKAVEQFDKALSLFPNYMPVYSDRGTAFNALKLHAKAAADYGVLLKNAPQFPFVKGLFVHQKMLTCDWAGVNELIKEINDDVAQGKKSATPFGWQALSSSPRSLQLCAEIYSANKFPRQSSTSSKPLRSHQKIRIGYLSGEFQEQATSHLLVGVLESHTESQFEIYAFDNGRDDGSEVRKRINSAVKRIVNIGNLNDVDVHTAIEKNEIDILVNLNGYFGKGRNAVFARRPAPIQINYLGFPGTLGADYIDYIIADSCVIPDDQKQFYTEKVVHLPHCYQANDDSKIIGTPGLSRSQFGWPDGYFVPAR